MKNMPSSALAPVIRQYLEIKQTLGRHYDVERRILLSLDRGIAQISPH